MNRDVMEEHGGEFVSGLGSISRPATRLSAARRRALADNNVVDRARQVRDRKQHPGEFPSLGQLPPDVARSIEEQLKNSRLTEGGFAPKTEKPAETKMSTGAKVAIGAGAGVGLLVLIKLLRG